MYIMLEMKTSQSGGSLNLQLTSGLQHVEWTFGHKGNSKSRGQAYPCPPNIHSAQVQVPKREVLGKFLLSFHQFLILVLGGNEENRERERRVHNSHPQSSPSFMNVACRPP